MSFLMHSVTSPMPSLYAATEFGTDLQTLGLLRQRTVDVARLRAFRKALGIPVPRVGRWVLRVALEHSVGRAEFPGWILAGHHPPEPAGLPTFLAATGPASHDALPSAYYGGMLRLGQSPNGAYWGADLSRPSMPVHLYDPSRTGIRHGWKRRFNRLDEFVFLATKAALCQRDRITVEEFWELLQEKGVRPAELVPDALEDERESLARLGLRKPKKAVTHANRFVWADVLLANVLGKTPSPDDVARLWVDVFRLHTLQEDHDDLTKAPLVAFWLFRHGLLGDQAGYDRVLQRATTITSPLPARADREVRRWWSTKNAAFDRAAVARAIEKRADRLADRGRSLS